MITGWNFKWLDTQKRCCSMLCIEVSPRWSLHLGVERDAWVFGHYTEPYDLCLDHWGFGPFFDIIRWNGALDDLRQTSTTAAKP